MYTGLILSTHYFCQVSMNLELYGQIFEKYSNIIFHENPSCGSRVLCERVGGRTDGQTDRQTDRQTDMKKLIVAFLNFVKAP